MLELRALAVVLLLAALAYLLYVWSKRRNMIDCPSCGAKVHLYDDQCPYCGHEKGDVVDTDAPADAGDSDTAQDDAERYDKEEVDETDYDALVAEHTVAEVKDRVKEDDLDPQKVLEAEQANKDRVTLTDWLEDRMGD